MKEVKKHQKQARNSRAERKYFHLNNPFNLYFLFKFNKYC